MARMTRAQAEDFLLQGGHTGTQILSVPQNGKGPPSVPLASRYANGGFEFSTKPTRLHAKAFMRPGRATVIVHYERYGDGGTLEQYVMVEGPIGFISSDVHQDADAFYKAKLEPETFIAVEYA